LLRQCAEIADHILIRFRGMTGRRCGIRRRKSACGHERTGCGKQACKQKVRSF
jgi:hypothetical protein